MDNASKALIIAGGVLVAVLVISICMYMYSSFKTMYAENMVMHSLAQKEAFNMFFMQYPSKITGYEAYNIIGKVEEINASEDALNSIIYSGINKEETFYFTKNFDSKYNYSYEMDSDGLISEISISQSE